MKAWIGTLIVFLVVSFPGLVIAIAGLIKYGWDWSFGLAVGLWWAGLAALLLLLLGVIKW
jgi:hypothetical protein